MRIDFASVSPKRSESPAMLAHGGASFIRIDAERPKFPVERGTLHADEFGRSGDISAKAVDLREQIFALEDLLGIAQGQRHQMLSPCPIGRQRHCLLYTSPS